jgi:hypothetical protein
MLIIASLFYLLIFQSKFLLGQQDAQDCLCRLVIDTEVLIEFSDKIATESNLNSIQSKKDCEKNCRYALADYLDYEDLKELDNLSFSLNKINQAADKLCKLTNEKIWNPGKNVALKIAKKSDLNFFNKEISLGSLCCNRPCSCKIKSKNSDVSVRDFDALLSSNQNQGYACQDELILCEKECRNSTSDYLNYEPLRETVTYKQKNIFSQNKDIGDFMCRETQKLPVNTNLNLYILIVTQSNINKQISLGKLCCKRPCNCQLIYSNNTFSDRISKELLNLNNFLPQSERPYYECKDETSICLNDCVKAANSYYEKFKSLKFTLPLTSLDLFANFDFGIEICQMLSRPVEDPGVNVYLRYSTNSKNNKFNSDDLHIGNYIRDKNLILKNKMS